MKKKTLLYLGAAALGAAASAYVALYLRKQALLMNARADVARQNYLDEYALHDRYTHILGSDTHYYTAGANHNTPLVMLHGGIIEAATFSENIKTLSQDRLVLAPDMPMHGRSSFLAPHRTLEWFNEWVDMMGLEQFDLCAHSTGGGIAVRYALQHPQRVRRLILCAPTGFGIGFPKISFKPTLPRFSDDIVEHIWGVPSRLSNADRYHFNMVVKEFFSSGRWWWYLSGGAWWMTDIPSTQLRRLHTPTLVIWGDRDPLVPLNREVVALLPNAQLKILESAGHVMYIEMANEFNEVVKEFISDK